MLKLEEQLLYTELNKIGVLRKREQQKEAYKTQPVDLLEEIEKTQEKDVRDSIVLQEREAIRILINYGFNKTEEK